MPYVRELQVRYVKRRMPERSLPQGPVSSPEDAAAFFIHIIGNEPVERLVALFLDTQNRPLAFRQVAQGAVGTAPAPIGEIAKAALLANASSVIVAHNHPSGSLEPSVEDRAVARKTREALSLVEIRLHDFLVVGDSDFRSALR